MKDIKKAVSKNETAFIYYNYTMCFTFHHLIGPANF